MSGLQRPHGTRLALPRRMSAVFVCTARAGILSVPHVPCRVPRGRRSKCAQKRIIRPYNLHGSPRCRLSNVITVVVGSAALPSRRRKRAPTRPQAGRERLDELRAAAARRARCTALPAARRRRQSAKPRMCASSPPHAAARTRRRRAPPRRDRRLPRLSGARAGRRSRGLAARSAAVAQQAKGSFGAGHSSARARRALHPRRQQPTTWCRARRSDRRLRRRTTVPSAETTAPTART